MDDKVRKELERQKDWGNVEHRLDQQMTERLEALEAVVSYLEQAYPPMVTPPSSRVIEPQEEAQPGSSISSRTWHLVREGRDGASEITATVTFPAYSSPPTLGDAQKFLLECDYTLTTPAMWASLRQLGLTPPSPQSSGPSAGVEAAGDSDGPACEHEWLADRGWAGCDVCQRVGCKALRIDGKLYLPQPEGGA